MEENKMFQFLSPPKFGDETYEEQLKRLEWESRVNTK